MDPEVFTSPKEFNPGRFLDECGNLKRVEEFAPFSVGRRICMGESLAKNSRFSSLSGCSKEHPSAKLRGDLIPTTRMSGLQGVPIRLK